MKNRVRFGWRALAFAAAFGWAAAAQAQYYGAIAYGPGNGAWGTSYDFSSRWEAERVAMSNCAANGYDCRILVWFENACGALAINGAGAYGSGWGTNRGIAEGHALNVCSRNGGGCYVSRWVCTTR